MLSTYFLKAAMVAGVLPLMPDGEPQAESLQAPFTLMTARNTDHYRA